MRFNLLDEWLSWQETLNPREIDLGLDRVSEVLKKLDFSADFFCPVISVAGTNGKGSTVAFIESILKQSDISVGCYTSPHLFDYNERIRINQQAVSDEDLCEAFETIDQLRGQVPLTYFEFGTLAALLIFKKYNVDVAVLEVGLGGRLDAVNVIDADVSVITSIDIDHVDWLGNDIELIAREKAGIMRAGRPVVVGFFNPPQSLMDYAQQLNVSLIRLGHDYLYQALSNGMWQIKSANLQLDNLPAPGLRGGFQLQNAASAIMAIQSLGLSHMPGARQIGKGLQQVKLAGRFQTVLDQPRVIVDVAHNEQSAGVLCELLRDSRAQQAKPGGKNIGVVAMLSDKAVSEVLQKLSSEIDYWFSAGLEHSRGMSAKNMAQAVRDLHADVKLGACETVAEACEQAKALCNRQGTEYDQILVFGSFYTVAEASIFFKSNS